MKHGAAFLILAVGFAGPACAQVESASGAQVVYDPMTNATRVTDPLFQPGAAQAPVALSSASIRLHMPKRHVVHRAPAVAAAPPIDEPAVAEAAPAAPIETAPAPEPASPPPPTPKVAKKAPKVAEAAPVAPVSAPQEMAAPSGPDAAIPFSMDSGTAAYAPPPKNAKHGKTERVASAEPPPALDGKHIRIIFTAGATEPTPETAASVVSVASNLNASLRTGSDRVLLQSYGGAAGDKSSDSRRLCLKRALSVRQLLIDAGIPSDRIDVRAMGGAGIGDPPDRVDLIVHG